MKKAAIRGLHHRSSQNKPAAGWRSAGSGVSGAVRALTGDELRQKKDSERERQSPGLEAVQGERAPRRPERTKLRRFGDGGALECLHVTHRFAHFRFFGREIPAGGCNRSVSHGGLNDIDAHFL